MQDILFYSYCKLIFAQHNEQCFEQSIKAYEIIQISEALYLINLVMKNYNSITL